MASRYPEAEAAVRERYERIRSTLDERARRLFAANEALSMGFGGVLAVHRATGIARSTIKHGILELGDLPRRAPPTGRQRQAGAGRKRIEETSPEVVAALKDLVEATTRGDPESPLLWTSKSLAKLARELATRGLTVSPGTVRRLLSASGFTMQKTRKTLDGASHPDRDAQFEKINALVKRFQADGQPAISVDTKKKELVGDFANNGREWHEKGKPTRVLTHDFPNGVPKAVPYGVYDMTRNEGMVSVGVSGDTAEFATASILRWWTTMGQPSYEGATDLLITADCGGSNGYRVRLWRLMVQRLADATGLAVTVAHLPPGTSKWNKIEHRLFSFISLNWRGRPLVSYETIVELIGSTRTTKGLQVRCEIDESQYERGIEVSDEDLDAVFIERDDFHGEWNYTIYPATVFT